MPSLESNSTKEPSWINHSNFVAAKQIVKVNITINKYDRKLMKTHTVAHTPS